MFTRRHLLSAILTLTLLNGSMAAAQTVQESRPATAVTAAASGSSARFTAPQGVLQMRLEIYASTGELVFDSGARGGSVIDWKATDATQPLADGSYLCVVTVKDLNGKLSQRLGSVSLKAGSVSLGRASESDITAAQGQALAAKRQAKNIEPATGDNSMTILREDKSHAVTITTHDGQNGHVTSTSGALTLRTGDVLTGQDKEQMRVTPDGRVGIGTDKPEATLDVAGTIRARGGIRFDDGTVITSAGQLTSSSSKVFTATGSTASASTGTTTTENLAGTGTANRLAKWLDNAGTLGDSAVTEAGGKLGVGTFNPAALLHVGQHAGYGATTGLLIANNLTGSQYDRAFQIAPVQTASPLSNSILMYALPTVNAGINVPSQYGLFLDGKQGTGTVQSYAGVTTGQTPSLGATNNTHLLLGTVAIPSGNYGVYDNTGFRNYFKGNVGIGVTAPAHKLEVTGNIKLNGAGNGIIFPDGTTMTTATAGGGSMSGDLIVSNINAQATTTINDTKLSPNLGRLNGANAWSGSNVFGAGLSANNALITNVGNPVNAGDATNKAYVDANFVKFVPGAEQLSVGDANGTATMINLRGGSTCCSGPGGHTPAFFKVFQNGSFVATGNLGIGTSPMEGKGYRTSWHTYKGAFRSGYADNEWDDANVGFFSWAGGSNSTASGLYALAFGDTNFARSTSSIAFGSGNEVKGAAGFSAGAGNRVCDTYGVALGNNARSGGPYIDGKCDPETFNIRGLAAVAIGYNVTADQDHTMAFGKFASNNGFQGTFIWSDGAPQASADTFRNTANNEFAARATGGFRFRTNLGGTTGCNLPAGSGVFNCTSSRYTKENFSLVKGDDVLTRLRKIPVSTWNYLSEGRQVRHMGPMAEDFYGAFGLGTGNTSIGVQDLAGVSLAAVKALDERTIELQQKTAEVETLRGEVNALRAANAAFEQRLAALEQSMKATQEASRSTTSPR